MIFMLAAVVGLGSGAIGAVLTIWFIFHEKGRGR